MPDAHGVLYCNTLDNLWTLPTPHRGLEPDRHISQAAGSAVKTGLDYVGVGLSYAKNVRINASISAHNVLAHWDLRCLHGYDCIR